MPTELASEDWKKEFEKIVLTKKYARASTLIGICSSMPTIENVKNAYGMVVDYVTAMPLPNDTKTVETRKEFIKELDDIGLILFGTYSKWVKTLEKKYGVFKKKTRQSLKVVDAIQNLPNLVKALRDILIRAGEFATSSGLRVTLAQRRTYGKDRILEEEGFEDLEI